MNGRVGRRAMLGAGGAVLLGVGARAVSRPRVEVWRDPHCGCCGGWVEHLRAAGFEVEDRVVQAVAPYRRLLGTPVDLLSCHAGRVGGYGLEGHVPAAAIRRLLAQRPADVAGLAVPGMPVGSPGMEVPGRAPEAYDVVAWDTRGDSRVWMQARGEHPA